MENYKEKENIIDDSSDKIMLGWFDRNDDFLNFIGVDYLSEVFNASKMWELVAEVLSIVMINMNKADELIS